MEPTTSLRSDDGGILLSAIRVDPDQTDGRLPLYQDGTSFAAYFSAFPASYWARWTTLSEVELRLDVVGAGTVRFVVSDASGVAAERDSREVDGRASVTFRLPLEGLADGGWAWFELDGQPGGLRLESGGWWAPAGVQPPRRLRVAAGITTLNRQAFLLPLLRTLIADPASGEVLERIIIVDHGSARVAADPGFPAIAEDLGYRLVLVEQDNLGGSGGFARAMRESLAEGCDAVVLLDDDIDIDPESLRRLIRFAEFATVPTIVGGHMFDMEHRARLHAFSEGIRWKKFFWETNGEARHDFAESGLADTAWLHERFDADYNGWWMCLVPAEVMREQGLAVPYFIKWDDAEYGVRARGRGIPTVTLPGAAVWHVSWENKDDTIDWQGYFHARNRLVTALLHSPFRGGGQVVRANFELSVKYLLGMEYGAARLRVEAFKDVLAGPGELHASLRTAIGRARAILADTPTIRSLDATEWTRLREGVPRSPLRAARFEQICGARFVRAVLRLGLRNLRRSTSRDPEVWMPAVDARWWNVGRSDSLLIENAAGDGGRWLRRDRREFFALLRETARLTRQLRRRWSALSAEYRGQLPALVSEETWGETFSGRSSTPPTAS